MQLRNKYVIYIVTVLLLLMLVKLVYFSVCLKIPNCTILCWDAIAHLYLRWQLSWYLLGVSHAM